MITPLASCINLHSLHRLDRERYPFLLQSTAENESLGHYDILFACPGETIVADSETLDFLDRLDHAWQRERVQTSDVNLPFAGGWFLYLGYELAGEVEPSLNLDNDELLPAAFAVRCPAAVIRDNISSRCFVVAEDEADSQLIQADIERCANGDCTELAGTPVELEVDEEADQGFLDAVVSAKEYISAGDIYQANLSRRWFASADHTLDADRIYLALSERNPAPFAGLVSWQGTSIVSSSPERLLRIRDGIASTRPIAGTRPRSDDRNTDDSLSAELFAHPKERAEHVMLIDLERNDLGRICEAGTVEVDEMMVLESYAHVHHIVSNVRGELRADVTPGDAIRAVFPGGTITGCPKVRCMEIISALEHGPRGAYTGSFGYLNRDGSLDLNILIRTMVLHGKEVSLRAGAGIVSDSEPEAELQETRAKAKGMLRALAK